MGKVEHSRGRRVPSPLCFLLDAVSKVSQHPIEVIVMVFVFMTLAYFALVHAITNSTLFSSLSDVASLSIVSMRAGHSTLPIFEKSSEDGWHSLQEHMSGSPDRIPDMGFADWLIVIDESSETSDLQAQRRDYLLPAITKALQEESQGRCEWPVSRFTDTNQTVGDVVICFDPQSSYDTSHMRHLLDTKTLQRVLAHAMQTIPPDMDPTLVSRWKRGDVWLQPLTPTSHGPEAFMKESVSLEWLISLVGSAFWRAWIVIHQADPIDFTFLLAAYIMMHGSFVHLYVSMSHFPKRFWLGTCVLLSSSFAFLLALVSANMLSLPVDPVILSEGLPFLVITVGFEKPYLLTKAFFSQSAPETKTHTDMAPHSRGTPEDDFVRALTQRVQEEQELGILVATPKPVPDVAVRAVSDAGPGLFRAYGIEMSILLLGILSGIHGLREFCCLAMLILFFDSLLLFTFFLAVLCVTLEVNRIRQPLVTPEAQRESDKDTPTEAPAEPQVRGPPKHKSSHLSLYQRVFGSMDHPLSRLKFMLLFALVALHSLNMLSTLSLPTTIARHHTARPRTMYEEVVSSSDMFRASMTHPAMSTFFHVYDMFSAAHVVAFMPPSVLILTDRAHTVSGSLAAAAMKTVTPRYTAFDSFMHTWTSVASDPVIGKWLSLALLLSVFLNTFLLKGIAMRNPAVIEGNAVRVTAQAAARLIGAHLEEDWYKTPKTREEPSSTPRVTFAPPPPSVPPPASSDPPRPYNELRTLFDKEGPGALNNEEIVLLVQKGVIAPYALEKVLQDYQRAVLIRRAVLSRASETHMLENSLLPFKDYDYASVFGACCENVVGYMPLPLGIAGPLVIDGYMTPIPMATTEGTLVASTSRGCKVLNANGGVTTVLTQDAMTRGPVIEFPTLTSAARAKRWIDSGHGADEIKAAFDSTSRFARLTSLHTVLAGRTLYVRFATSTGDAMGMNMISKGVEAALGMMKDKHFPEMELLSLSGNYCIDKKPAAINWIEGRGKSVVAEAVIRGDSVRSILKCTVEDLVRLNTKKNLVGSAMAGSIGGFNAHAANILTAMYIATGQDPAQNVESSNCMTLMEAVNDGKDLLVSVSMPSVEVGTVGGGTGLAPQRSMLELLGVQGPNRDTPGANAQRLARIIAAAVMAGELSLMGALSAGHLIKAHMAHNRSAPPTPGTMSPMPRDQQYKPTMTPLIATPIADVSQRKGLTPMTGSPR